MTHRIINATAPVRICDIGGWTDTWFAGYGAVFSIAVSPGVNVQLRTVDRTCDERVTIELENYGDTYQVDPDAITIDRHPLIEAVLSELHIREDIGIELTIYSEIPPGASTGTSAAVTVALIAALDLLTIDRKTDAEIAAIAHSIETDTLGLQSGVQDQIASAAGGINYIVIDSYPHASTSTPRIPADVLLELERRLTLVYIGAPHQSSRVHEMVIHDLEDDKDSRLACLRLLARHAKNALAVGDFPGFGRIMNANTEEQRRLNSELVCERFETIIDIASKYGALGCKVNGAGGDGGSVTILSGGDATQKRRMAEALTGTGAGVINVRISPNGVTAWDTK